MKKLPILLAVLFVMISCNIFSPDNGDGDSEPTLANKLEAALYEVPESLRGGSDVSGSASRDLDPSVTVSSDLTGTYALLTYYLSYADDARSLVEEMIVAIIEEENLGALFMDTVYLLNDENMTGFAVVTNTAYDYDIQLYTDTIETADGAVTEPTVSLEDCVTEPALIIRFSEADGGVEGEAWFVFTDGDDGETEITLYVAFDSDGSDGTLEIRFYLDTDEAVSAEYEAEELEDFNFRPDRIFLNLSKTRDVVEMEGTSYHPRAQLNENWIFSDNAARTMYSFTAVAAIDTGAVVNLALPLDTDDNNDGLWTTHNLGSLWKEVVRIELNDILEELSDGSDDAPEDFEGNQYVQKFMAAYLMDLIVDFELDTFDDYRTGSSDFTQIQFDEAYAFWTDTTLTEITDAMDSVTDDAAALNDYFDTAEPTEEELEYMEFYYLILTAPELIAEAADREYTIVDADQIVDYALNGDPEDEWAGDLYPFVVPCLYMINPAFFSDTDGLLGTLNEENDTFYGTSGVTEWPGDYDILLLLLNDLDDLEPFIPITVAGSTIPGVGDDPGL